MEIDGLSRVATYEREVAASLERAWENVLDWEHLPWLHRTTFSSIERIESGGWGWRARVGFQARAQPRESVLELCVERDAGRYVSRTLEGAGGGTEIWTHLSALGEQRTGIRVEFHVPGTNPDPDGRLAARYRGLYAQLWDEDEAMMRRRARLLAAPAVPSAGLALPPATAAGSLELGSLRKLRAELPLVVAFRGREFRIVDLGAELVAHAVRCPHMLGPLDEGAVEGGAVRCPWHGYRFDLRSGRCSESAGLRLPPAPRVVVEAESDEVRLVDPASPA